jgi:hypothetical protein
VDSVEVVIQDLEGNEIRKLNGIGSKGLHQILWNLRRSAPPRQEGQRRARSGGEVAAGVYKIVFMVDSKEVQIKKFEVEDDPILTGK